MQLIQRIVNVSESCVLSDLAHFIGLDVHSLKI